MGLEAHLHYSAHIHRMCRNNFTNDSDIQHSCVLGNIYYEDSSHMEFDPVMLETSPTNEASNSGRPESSAAHLREPQISHFIPVL